MIEREQLLKERDQILQEMQVGLRTIDEARERLKEMDRLQTALMKRLDHTRQQLGSHSSATWFPRFRGRPLGI